MKTNPPIKIDPTELSPDALRGVIEEFVTRDGTNLADAELKIRQVIDQIDRGVVEIWFDQDSRTCNLLPI